MKRLIPLLMIILILPSCFYGELPNETSADIASETEAFSEDPETVPVYEYTPSLSSKNEISEVGITIGGVTVEAEKLVDVSYDCIGYDSEKDQYRYSTYGENSINFTEDKLKNFPIMRSKETAEITVLVDNLEWNSSIISVNGPDDYNLKGNRVDLPKDKGIYFLVVYVSVENPRNNENLTPIVGETYVSSYQYVVGIVVE